MLKAKEETLKKRSVLLCLFNSCIIQVDRREEIFPTGTFMAVKIILERCGGDE